MTQVKFVLMAHENGRFRPFSAEAMRFWQEHGAVIGEALRAEAPLTLAEIVAAQSFLPPTLPQFSFLPNPSTSGSVFSEDTLCQLPILYIDREQ